MFTRPTTAAVGAMKASTAVSGVWSNTVNSDLCRLSAEQTRSGVTGRRQGAPGRGLPAGGTGGAGGARHAQYPNSSGGVTSVSSYSSSTHGSASTFVARLRHAAARGAARGASRGSARPWADNRGHASVRGRTRSAALGASGACRRGECR